MGVNHPKCTPATLAIGSYGAGELAVKRLFPNGGSYV